MNSHNFSAANSLLFCISKMPIVTLTLSCCLLTVECKTWSQKLRFQTIIIVSRMLWVHGITKKNWKTENSIWKQGENESRNFLESSLNFLSLKSFHFKPKECFDSEVLSQNALIAISILYLPGSVNYRLVKSIQLFDRRCEWIVKNEKSE